MGEEIPKKETKSSTSKKKIEGLFEKVLTPKCSNCGEPLSPYPFYDDHYEIRHCKKCGTTNRKKRVI